MRLGNGDSAVPKTRGESIAEADGGMRHLRLTPFLVYRADRVCPHSRQQSSMLFVTMSSTSLQNFYSWFLVPVCTRGYVTVCICKCPKHR